ncbi:hypothetical protein EG328_007678, partial [Venturia inaequalis]
MPPPVDEKPSNPIESPRSNESGQSTAVASYTPEEEKRVVRKIDRVVLTTVTTSDNGQITADSREFTSMSQIGSEITAHA